METIRADKSVTSDSRGAASYRALFVNWQSDEYEYDRADLLDGTDFRHYDIVFFDPLGFAVSHGMRPDTNDISLARYESFPDHDFRRYLSGVKKAVAGLHAMIEAGGIFVIRAQFPNVQFKIRKKSSVGSSTYTESVVSPYFWIQEFLGSYSFEYCSKNTIQFVERRNPLAKLFDRSPVICLQTLNSVSAGKLETIAQTVTNPKRATLARIKIGEGGGIYLVPQFTVKGEGRRLVEAFRSILGAEASGAIRPAWVDAFESDLEAINPFRFELERLNKEIEAIENEKLAVLAKLEETMRLVDLLVESEYDLAESARIALRTLGFECPNTSLEKGFGMFEAVFNGQRIRRAIVRSASDDDGTVSVMEIQKLLDRIENSSFKVKPKGILVGNASRLIAPGDRVYWFQNECFEIARKADISLVPSYELYLAACHCLAKSRSENIEHIRSSMCRELMANDGEFKLNRVKYGIS